MQYCDKCGGPLRRSMSVTRMMDTVKGCRLCWLALPPMFRLRPLEWRGWNEQGNSTADSPATSTWLPDGAFEPISAQHRGTPPANPEAWRLRHWLSTTAHRDTNPLRTRQVNNGRRVFLRHYSEQPPHPWAITHHGVTVE